MTTSHAPGGKEPTGRKQPGDADDALDTVVHEQQQRQQADPVGGCADHHPLVAMLSFFQCAAVDGEEADHCRHEHVAHDVESTTTRALNDDPRDRPEVSDQKSKEPELHANPFEQTKALDVLVKWELLYGVCVRV